MGEAKNSFICLIKCQLIDDQGEEDDIITRKRFTNNEWPTLDMTLTDVCVGLWG